MDIVKRLRLGSFSPFSGEYIKDDDMDEAADEIERLRDALREIIEHDGYPSPTGKDLPAAKIARKALGEKE